MNRESACIWEQMNEKCDICGEEGDVWEIDVFHRACRLRRAFPGACSTEGGQILFDPAKIKEHLERQDAP